MINPVKYKPLKETDSATVAIDFKVSSCVFHKTRHCYLISACYMDDKHLTIYHPLYMMSIGNGPVEFKQDLLKDSERWAIVDASSDIVPVYDDGSLEGPRFIRNANDAKENELALSLALIKDLLSDNTKKFDDSTNHKLFHCQQLIESVLTKVTF